MGERATVEYNGVTIYTHWEGDRVKEHIKKVWNSEDGQTESFPSLLLNSLSNRQDDNKSGSVLIVRSNDIRPVDIDIPKQTILGYSFNDFLSVDMESFSDACGTVYIRLDKEDKIEMHYWTKCDSRIGMSRIQDALCHRCRWDDAHYLTRIIYDALCGYSFEETGFGISGGASLQEGRHFSINPETRTISWSDYGGQGGKNEPIDEILKEW